ASLVNYVLNAAWKQDVSVREDGQDVDLRSVPVTNQLIRGTVTVSKVDADSGLPLAGVTFQLKQEGVVKYEAVTDSSGMATFTSVAYGDYVLVESATLVSHVLRADYAADVAVREHGARVDAGMVENPIKRGTITLSKVDAETGAPLAGAVFSLFAKTGDRVSESAFDTRTSAPDGSVSFERVPYGEYVLREVQAPEGYLPDTSARSVRIDDDGQRVSVGKVANQLIRGSITLTKVDAETRARLAGAVFELVNAQGGVVGEQTSRTDGVVSFEGVPYGEYVVREKSAPASFLPSSVTLKASITRNEQVVALGEYVNTAMRGSIRVHKIDAETGQPLQGVKFGVYQQPENMNLPAHNTDNAGMAGAGEQPQNGAHTPTTNTDTNPANTNPAGDTNPAVGGALSVPAGNTTPAGEASPAEGELVAVGVSDVNGDVVFAGLRMGSYVVRELVAAPGYNRASSLTRMAVLQKDGQVVQVEDVENTPIRADIVLRKQDKAGHGLAGAVFEAVHQESGQRLSATSGSDGVVRFSAALYGQWVVREVHAPHGYLLNQETRTVNVSEQDVTVDAGVIVNEPVPVKIGKSALAMTGAMPLIWVLAASTALAGLTLITTTRTRRTRS
ncbi:MSCRAMM family protein, partial [Schaalia sp. lx-260]|uniref:MSCRAMM family protein n=1 Tax=Schaalia sp. lx-260 TaxID=2899082 RepID=UPI0022AC81B6